MLPNNSRSFCCTAASCSCSEFSCSGFSCSAGTVVAAAAAESESALRSQVNNVLLLLWHVFCVDVLAILLIHLL